MVEVADAPRCARCGRTDLPLVVADAASLCSECANEVGVVAQVDPEALELLRAITAAALAEPEKPKS